MQFPFGEISNRKPREMSRVDGNVQKTTNINVTGFKKPYCLKFFKFLLYCVYVLGGRHNDDVSSIRVNVSKSISVFSP